MTEQRPALDEVQLATLTTLANIAANRRGFRRGHVRGWIPGPDVKDVVGNISAGWRLPRLRQLGLVTSQAARDAGRPRSPIVMWRITQAGEDEIARLLGRAPRRVARPREDPDDQHQIYVSRRAWNLLTVLQRRREPVPWKTAESAAADAFGSRFLHDALTALLKRGFAERENREVGRSTEVWVVATAFGRQVRATDLKASTSIVQLRVPGG